jgi:hypothetical protein
MPEPGVSLNMALFRQALAKRLASIARLCVQWDVPMAQHTLILRDPDNDNVNDCPLKEAACSWLTPAPAEAGEAALPCAD